MVGQHDAACAHTYFVGTFGDVADCNRCGCAGNTRHIVVLGHPETRVTPLFGMTGQIARIVKRNFRIAVVADTNQVKNGILGHKIELMFCK